MAWEIRFHREARTELYSIERGIAGLVTDELDRLSKTTNLAETAELINNPMDEIESNLIEIEGHFIEFQLWVDEQDRRIMIILSVEAANEQRAT